MILWFILPLAGIAAAYQLVAIAACVRHLLAREPTAISPPPVSILKPVRGLDPAFEPAILSHAGIDYPEFEILFGVADPDDPALPAIRRLMTQHRNVRLIHSSTSLPNGKAGVLYDLAREARYEVLVVNDSDIRVERDYLTRLMGPLVDGAGLVTCLYRADASGFPGRFEALGIATDFAPSTLVAPLVGVNEFGLGSTLAFRAADLERAGGFAAIGPYLADDYQVGKRISGLGKRVWLSTMVVDTHVGGSSWGEIWNHQVRWARTIRVSHGGGYAGLALTNASAVALLAAFAGMTAVAAGLLALRYLMAFCAAWLVLRDRRSIRLLWLTPVRDLFGLAVWAAGLAGNEVRWRDKRLRLTNGGRIV